MFQPLKQTLSLACFGLSLCFPVNAAVQFERLAADGTDFIVVNGEFEFADRFDELIRLVTAHRPNAIVFNSPGGNIYSAMALGRLIRSLSLDTFQTRLTECTSACAFAFLGGVRRFASPGSIGLHRTSLAGQSDFGTEDAVAGIQQSTADILQYLEEMGVDPGLLQVSLRYGSDDMRYLSASEMAELKVTTVANESSRAEKRPAPLPKAPARKPERSAHAMKAQALDLVQRVVRAHTMGDELALHLVRSMYANSVSYFGKQVRLPELLEDKRRYFRRWPERSYRIRDDSITVICGSAHCTVAGVYHWSVRSLPRNRKASGTATFSFIVNFEASALITYENSEVISR